MAEIIEEAVENAELAAETVEMFTDDTDNLGEQPEPIVDEQPEEQPEDETPYAGKTREELAKMIEDQKSMIGRQSAEVGELRRQVQQIQESQKPETPELTDADYFAKPKEAIRQEISSSPEAKQMREATRKMQIQAGLAELRAKHPDLDSVLKNDDFKAWVAADAGRQVMYRQADEHMDVVMADSLVSTFKEMKNIAGAGQAAEKMAQKKAVQSAATGGARSNPDSSGGKPVFSRAALMDMRLNNPEKYERHLDVIELAYLEGRVR